AATTTLLKGTGPGIPASGRVTDQRRGSASAGLVGSGRSLLTVCVGRRHRAGWKLCKGARFGPKKRTKEVLSRGPRVLKPMPRRPDHRSDRRRGGSDSNGEKNNDLHHDSCSGTRSQTMDRLI